MGDFALIEEETFQALVNAYATLETLRQRNPGFMDTLKFDETMCNRIKIVFQDDFIQVPIDLSEQALEKLEEKFGKEGD